MDFCHPSRGLYLQRHAALARAGRREEAQDDVVRVDAAVVADLHLRRCISFHPKEGVQVMMVVRHEYHISIIPKSHIIFAHDLPYPSWMERQVHLSTA